MSYLSIAVVEVFGVDFSAQSIFRLDGKLPALPNDFILHSVDSL